MSHETRRRIVLALVALIVVAMVLSLVGCTTTTGDSGGDDGATGPLTTDSYPAAMEEICAATSTELGELPEPPEMIALGDWATEVSRILGNEADRFADLRVPAELSESHGSLMRTAREQSDRFADLGRTIDEAGGDSDEIGPINDEIRSLSLGREELAAELAIPGCGTRAFA